MNFFRRRHQLWKIEKLSQHRGKYLNSPLISNWNECGVIAARDREAASIRAMFVVGSSQIRVSPVDEFYRPKTLR